MVSKASSGVMEMVPIHSVNETVQFLSAVKQMDWNVIGTHSSRTANEDGTPSYPVSSYQLEKSSVIIIGNNTYILLRLLKCFS